MTQHRHITKALVQPASGFRICHSLSRDENLARFRRFVDRLGRQHRQELAPDCLRRRMKARRAIAALVA